MTIDFQSNLITVCRQHIPNIKLLYLFGSHASNQTHIKSDIDLAVMFSKKTSTVARWEIQQK